MNAIKEKRIAFLLFSHAQRACSRARPRSPRLQSGHHARSGSQTRKNAMRFSFHSGVSLLETVLYIGIFAIITLLTVNTVLALTRAVGEIRTIRHTIRDADIAMERMIREIRAAKSVDTAASVLASHPGKLVLASDSEITTFSFSNGKIFLKKNGGQATPLTSDFTTVTNLVFTRLTMAHSEAIRIAMTIDNKNFYGTAILRGSYK